MRDYQSMHSYWDSFSAHQKTASTHHRHIPYYRCCFFGCAKKKPFLLDMWCMIHNRVLIALQAPCMEAVEGLTEIGTGLPPPSPCPSAHSPVGLVLQLRNESQRRCWARRRPGWLLRRGDQQGTQQDPGVSAGRHPCFVRSMKPHGQPKARVATIRR